MWRLRTPQREQVMTTDKHISLYNLPMLEGDGHVEFTVELPPGAEILEAGALYGRGAAVWVLEDLEDPAVPEDQRPPKDKVTLQLFGTGRRISTEDYPSLEFLGTAQLGGGDHVVHVFRDKQAQREQGDTPPAPGNGSGNDAANTPQAPPDRGGGGESTPENSPPSTPPAGTPPAAPEPQQPPAPPPAPPVPAEPRPPQTEPQPPQPAPPPNPPPVQPPPEGGGKRRRF